MLIALAVHVALAAGVPVADVDKALEPKVAGLVQTYKELHASPELSGKEEKTSAKIASRLKQLGYKVTDHFGSFGDDKKPAYGVVAVLKNGEGPTLLIRADMDALPVTEETGLPYASKVKTKTASGVESGVMHACAHDVHMASLLGTADLMVQLKDRWKGTLVLIAQQAEEVGTGARAMLAGGLYEKFGKPNYVIGLHADSEYAAGVVTSRGGYMLADTNSVDVTLRGVGGHGAYPNLVKDPVVMAAEFVMAVQTLVSREVPPGQAAVVTVGSIHGGTKHNIVPDEVNLQLTVRSYKEEVRKILFDGIRRIANGVAATAGVPADRAPVVHVADESTPALYNNPELTARLMTLWRQELGDSVVRDRDPRMGGDDVARYSLPDHSIPETYFFVGASDPKLVEAHDKNGAPLPANHSAKFAPIPDVVIKRGVEATVLAATSLLPR